MRSVEFANPFKGSTFKTPVYHGTNEKFSKFHRPAHGVFFTPHREWAAGHYGTSVLTCYINAPNVYQLQYGKEFDEKVIDAFFDRNYAVLPEYIQLLKSKGYVAMQAPGDSEMICVFDNAPIVNAATSKEM